MLLTKRRAKFANVGGGRTEVHHAKVGLFGHMLPVILELQLTDLAVPDVSLLHFKTHLRCRLLDLIRLTLLSLHLLCEFVAF